MLTSLNFILVQSLLNRYIAQETRCLESPKHNDVWARKRMIIPLSQKSLQIVNLQKETRLRQKNSPHVFVQTMLPRAVNFTVNIFPQKPFLTVAGMST